MADIAEELKIMAEQTAQDDPGLAEGLFSLASAGFYSPEAVLILASSELAAQGRSVPQAAAPVGATSAIMARLKDGGFFAEVTPGKYRSVRADQDVYLAVRQSSYGDNTFSAFYDENSAERNLTFELVYLADRVLMTYAQPTGINRDEADRLVRTEIGKWLIYAHPISIIYAQPTEAQPRCHY